MSISQYKVQWQYCRSVYWRNWVDMPDETSALLEEAHSQRKAACQYVNRTHQIDFNLKTREQVSTDYAYARVKHNIRRVLIDLEEPCSQWTAAQPTDSQPTGSQPTETPGAGSQPTGTPGAGSQPTEPQTQNQ